MIWFRSIRSERLFCEQLDYNLLFRWLLDMDMVEESLGWAKTVACFRKTRFRGRARTQVVAHLVATAYNLLRMAKTLPT